MNQLTTDLDIKLMTHVDQLQHQIMDLDTKINNVNFDLDTSVKDYKSMFGNAKAQRREEIE